MAHTFHPNRPVDDAKDQAQLAAGGISLRAERRIQEQVASGHALFTSTLTPQETVIAKMTGLAPLSQVMGSSMVHVGMQYAPITGGEIGALTQAYDLSRSRALGRMQQEASMLGAHAVVDVRFEGRGYAWAEHLIEFTAVGTAVRIVGQPQPRFPALTLLEPDELWKLHHAGYWPVGLSIGSCFWYEHHADCLSEGTWMSGELPTHTRAAVNARNIAVERFRGQAAQFQADGVVGVRVERRGHDYEYDANDRKHTAFRLAMTVMGTAVVKRNTSAQPPRPVLVVDLADLTKKKRKD